MGNQIRFGQTSFRLIRVFGLLALLMALVPSIQVSAQSDGSATVKVTSVGTDGSTPVPFARFQVIDPDGNVLATRETAPPNATTTFTIDFTTDAVYTVTMETPPACAFQPDDQTVGPFEDGDALNLTFSVAFEDGCTLGSVSVYAYTCPDALDVSIDDYTHYRDNCVDTVNDEDFTLAELPEGGQTFDLVTGQYGVPGRAPIVGLVPGDYALSQDDGNPGQTVAYCMTYDGTPVEAPSPSSTERASFNDDGQIELDLGDRERIACDFFAVSSTVDDGAITDDDDEIEDDESDTGEIVEGDDEAQPEGSEPAAIEFHVATCPTGYDGSDFYADCAGNGTDGVTFEVDGADTGHNDTATSSVPTSPGFGIAVISGLPADTYTMSEDVPGDFVSLFVYCADSPGGGPRVPTPENGSQAFDIELGGGQSVICDWYIIPDQQFVPGIVRLTKFTCAAGYGGSTFDQFTSDCTDVTEGVSFNLSNGAGFDLDKTTNEDGKVRFTDLAPGDDYVLTEDLPGDALENRVAFCATGDGEYIEYAVEENGSIDLDPINEGDEVQCLWYNVPADQGIGDGSGSVEIHFSICPEGTSSDFYNRCHDNPEGGVGFELNGPGSADAAGETDDDGKLTFAELPDGDYVLSQDPLSDFDLDFYAAFCTHNGESFATEYDDADGMRLRFELTDSENIVCDWYNVPKQTATVTPTPQPQTGGSITVIKRLCLDDLEDIKNLAEECEAYGAGVQFSLTSVQNGKVANGTTGNNSQIVFSGLADGAYALDEINGDWCKAQADNVDASGNVLVRNAGNTNVYIYNCGDRDIDTLPSTGTGASGSQWPGMLWLVAIVAVLLFAASFFARPALAVRRIRR